MTTPLTDTRAALEAAILKYGGDAYDSYEFHARPPDDRYLNAAITAHVAAEVARALACADSVDEARRLVEAHHLDLLSIADAVASLHGATGPGLRGHCVAQAERLRLATGAARGDILRALGVEA